MFLGFTVWDGGKKHDCDLLLLMLGRVLIPLPGYGVVFSVGCYVLAPPVSCRQCVSQLNPWWGLSHG